MRKLLIVACALLLLIPAAFSQNAQPIFSTNSSVTIITGNTFQVLRPATQNYNSLTIQNNNMSTTDNCFVDVTGLVQPGNTTATSVVTVGGVTLTAAQASVALVPGGSYQRYYPKLPRNQIVVTCATGGDSVYADVQ